MITQTKKGFHIKSAFGAIYDKNKLIAKMQRERDDLIAAAMDSFEMDSISEFEKAYLEYAQSLSRH